MTVNDTHTGTPILTARFDAALAYAVEFHRRQLRKGTAVPYAAHLLGAASLTLEMGGSEDDAIGAMLHDVVEDGGIPEALAEIREQFGGAVARIVAANSDTDEQPKPPWEERKRAYVAAIPHKRPDELRVSLADKLHSQWNLRACEPASAEATRVLVAMPLIEALGVDSSGTCSAQDASARQESSETLRFVPSGRVLHPGGDDRIRESSSEQSRAARAGDCSDSSIAAASGRTSQRANTAPLPRSRSVILRACSSSGATMPADCTVASACKRGAGVVIRRRWRSEYGPTCGWFSYLVPAGPSRLLRFRYAGAPKIRPQTREVHVRVRSISSIRASDRSVINGEPVTFSGRLRGGFIPPTGKLVELQYFDRGKWRTFRTFRAAASDGRWSYTYRFDNTRGTRTSASVCGSRRRTATRSAPASLAA